MVTADIARYGSSRAVGVLPEQEAIDPNVAELNGEARDRAAGAG